LDALNSYENVPISSAELYDLLAIGIDAKQVVETWAGGPSLSI